MLNEYIHFSILPLAIMEFKGKHISLFLFLYFFVIFSSFAVKHVTSTKTTICLSIVTNQ